LRADNTYIIASRYGSDTRDIISALCAAVPAAVNQVKPYIENILTPTGDPVKDTERACRYVRGLVSYKQDGFSEQKIQLPARLLKDTKVGDCKSFSLAVLSIITAMGYKGGFRFASYKQNKIPTHVYNFVFDNSGKKITFDACVESLKESPRYTYIKDMEVTYLAGSPIMVDSYDYLGRRKRGKGGRGGRGGNRGGGLKKIGLAPARGAFLLLVKLNVRGLATKLQQSIQKGSDKTKAFWSKVGGNFDKLKAEINKGAKKKPLLGIKKKGISGATSVEYLEEGIGIEPATLTAAAAAIAAASPILLAVSKLFKSQSIPEGEEDVISDDEKKDEPGLDPDGTGFEVTDSEAGSGTKETPGILTTGFKPSPLMIGAIGLGALGLLYILTKKKR
jgi:hypothetical protein